MLSSKQIRYLKGIAMDMKANYQIGKDGISDNFKEMIDKGLEANELLKIRVLTNNSAPVRELGLDIASATNSILVQTVGKVITLYRESKNHIYQLPR